MRNTENVIGKKKIPTFQKKGSLFLNWQAHMLYVCSIKYVLTYINIVWWLNKANYHKISNIWQKFWATINQQDIIGIHRKFYIIRAEYTFSTSQETHTESTSWFLKHTQQIRNIWNYAECISDDNGTKENTSKQVEIRCILPLNNPSVKRQVSRGVKNTSWNK